MKKRTLITVVLGLLVMVSILTTVYAEIGHYSRRLPAGGIHVDLTIYKKRSAETTDPMYNNCTESKTDSDDVYSFHTWVDQKNAGQVTNVLEIKVNSGNKNYVIRAHPVKGSECKGRASTIGLLSSAMNVEGFIEYR